MITVSISACLAGSRPADPSCLITLGGLRCWYGTRHLISLVKSRRCARALPRLSMSMRPRRGAVGPACRRRLHFGCGRPFRAAAPSGSASAAREAAPALTGTAPSCGRSRSPAVRRARQRQLRYHPRAQMIPAQRRAPPPRLRLLRRAFATKARRRNSGKEWVGGLEELLGGRGSGAGGGATHQALVLPGGLAHVGTEGLLHHRLRHRLRAGAPRAIPPRSKGLRAKYFFGAAPNS